jgi:tetratricopeptide (TPR) repeat protein
MKHNSALAAFGMGRRLQHRHHDQLESGTLGRLCRVILFVIISLGLMRPAQAMPDMAAQLADLERQWAKVSYQTPPANQKEAFRLLVQQAERISQDFPGQAEPLAWRGMILCSFAEATGGLGALDDVTQARDLFLQAKRINDHVLNGTIDGYLGTLYYKVPPWPVGFGDDKKAQRYFQQALNLNPTGIDPNYLYGHYLADQGKKREARNYLTRALQVPIRPDHADYDAGRRIDINAALATTN